MLKGKHCCHCCLRLSLAFTCRVRPGKLPSLQDLGFQVDAAHAEQPSSSSALLAARAGGAAEGGETRALRELHAFVTSEAAARAAGRGGAGGERSGAWPAAHGRDGAAEAGAEEDVGAAFVSNVGPWLALGCLSPRQVRG